MPGIVGFASISEKRESIERVVTNMQDIITHKKFYEKDAVIMNGICCGTRSHINLVQKNPQPFSKDKVHVWLDGEFHNPKVKSNGLADTPASDAELLHTLYTADSEFSFLKKIDGGFSAVLYDENEGKIHLISDRYGRQHLYWARYKEGIVWASELKAFTVLPQFRLEIDPEAVEEFIGIGHMLGVKTWFKGVQMMDAASRLTFDLASQTCETTRYWWWNELKTYTEKLNRNDLAEEVANLLQKAVENLSSLTNDTIGIALSGGRDSRAVFAAMNQNGDPIHALTFGQPNCLDMRIAAYAVKVKKGVHHIHELTNDNWLNKRLNAVWWTDGQVSLLHMNGVDAKSTKNFYQIIFNGLAGEALAGRTRPFELEDSREYLEDKFKNKQISASLKERILSNIMEADCPEAFGYNSRFRRFGAHGLNQGEAGGTRSRLPFLNNDLFEFIYRIPPELKKSARLYDTMLLLKFPEFFPDLAWHKQDASVRPFHKIQYYWLKSRFRLTRMAAKRGMMANIPIQHVDFANWIRSLPARQVFESVLMDREALYPEYVNRELVEESLQDHMKGENNAVMLGRYLTFELWLQQTFNKKYRN